MSTSIGVSAPSSPAVADALQAEICREPLALAHGIVAGKAPALGDSATNGALGFSNHNSAPLAMRLVRVISEPAAAFRRQLPKARILRRYSGRVTLRSPRS